MVKQCSAPPHSKISILVHVLQRLSYSPNLLGEKMKNGEARQEELLSTSKASAAEWTGVSFDPLSPLYHPIPCDHNWRSTIVGRHVLRNPLFLNGLLGHPSASEPNPLSECLSQIVKKVKILNLLQSFDHQFWS